MRPCGFLHKLCRFAQLVTRGGDPTERNAGISGTATEGQLEISRNPWGSELPAVPDRAGPRSAKVGWHDKPQTAHSRARTAGAAEALGSQSRDETPRRGGEPRPP